MEKINKYYIGIWTNADQDSPIVTFYELDVDGYIQRIITIYRDSTLKCATVDAGYLGEFFESSKLFSDQAEDVNSDPEFVILDSSEKNFSSLWEKLRKMEGFYLKPYSEYTEND